MVREAGIDDFDTGWRVGPCYDDVENYSDFNTSMFWPGHVPYHVRKKHNTNLKTFCIVISYGRPVCPRQSLLPTPKRSLSTYSIVPMHHCGAMTGVTDDISSNQQHMHRCNMIAVPLPAPPVFHITHSLRVIIHALSFRKLGYTLLIFAITLLIMSHNIWLKYVERQ